jgi:hypothetical protein
MFGADVLIAQRPGQDGHPFQHVEVELRGSVPLKAPALAQPEFAGAIDT